MFSRILNYIKRLLGFETEYFCDIYDFPKFKYQRINDGLTKMIVTTEDGKSYVQFLKTVPRISKGGQYEVKV